MNINNSPVVFLNGKWIQATDTMGGSLGYSMPSVNGVFDGLRAYGTNIGPQIFKPKEHFKRLHWACSRMAVGLNYSSEDLTEIAYQLLEKNDLQDAYIRVIAYLNGEAEEPFLLMTAWEWERNLTIDPLKVMVYQNKASRSAPDTKSCGNYIESVLATMEARTNGFDDVLWIDSKGFVTEGAGANFFFEKDEVLYTPPSNRVLPGITRATVIGYAREMGHKVVEKKFKAEDLMEADMAFFTSTTAEITGIQSIGGHEFEMDWEDTVGYSLFLMYRQRVVNNEFRDFTLV